MTEQRITLKTNDEYNGMMGTVTKTWHDGTFSVLPDGKTEAYVFESGEVVLPTPHATEFGIGSLGSTATQEQEAHEETTAILKNLDGYTRYHEQRYYSQKCTCCGAKAIDGAMFTTMDNGICDDCQ